MSFGGGEGHKDGLGCSGDIRIWDQGKCNSIGATNWLVGEGGQSHGLVQGWKHSHTALRVMVGALVVLVAVVVRMGVAVHNSALMRMVMLMMVVFALCRCVCAMRLGVVVRVVMAVVVCGLLLVVLIVVVGLAVGMGVVGLLQMRFLFFLCRLWLKDLALYIQELLSTGCHRMGVGRLAVSFVPKLA